MLVGAGALAYLARHGFALGWLGVALTTVPCAGFLGIVMVFKPAARTSARLPWLLAITTAGLGITMYAASAGEEDAALTVSLSAAGWIGFLLYDFWYSNLGRTPSPVLRVGLPLPAFNVESASGEVVASSTFAGGPLLLLFYRGNWCPLCMAQVKEIAKHYRELARRGVRVMLISPQPHANTRKLARRFDVPFEFLVDRDGRAARALGIQAEGGLPLGLEALGYDSDTVLPTAVLTDGDGKIVFLDQTDNYRVRPEPETFLRILDETWNS